MKFRVKERGCYIGIRVGDYWYYNEIGYDVFYVVEIVYLVDLRVN